MESPSHSSRLVHVHHQVRRNNFSIFTNGKAGHQPRRNKYPITRQCRLQACTPRIQSRQVTSHIWSAAVSSSRPGALSLTLTIEIHENHVNQMSNGSQPRRREIPLQRGNVDDRRNERILRIFLVTVVADHEGSTPP